MDTKIVGYILLIVGIILIIIAGTNVYLVFMGNAQPINLFQTVGVSLDLGELMGLNNLPGANNANLTQEIIDANSLNQMLNLTAHILLMGFVASVGYKLASLGTNLVRPIIVKAGDRPDLTTPKPITNK